MKGPTATSPDGPRDSTQISALVTLLGDEDPKVGETIAGHLREIGAAALPALEEALDGPDPVAGERARTLVRDLKQDGVLEAIRAYRRREGWGLEEGLVLISRLHDPDLDEAACSAPLNRMAEDLMLRLDPGDGVEPLISGMARYLHQEQRFTGNTDDYYDEGNSYLHTLLAHRKGIPISLSCLYLLLAQRLGLPFVGVAMPGHFLVRYDDGHEVRIVDPFNRGRILDRDGCTALLRGLGLAYDERYLESTDHRHILERTLKNLIAIYANREQTGPLTLHQRALDALRGGA